MMYNEIVFAECLQRKKSDKLSNLLLFLSLIS